MWLAVPPHCQLGRTDNKQWVKFNACHSIRMNTHTHIHLSPQWNAKCHTRSGTHPSDCEGQWGVQRWNTFLPGRVSQCCLPPPVDHLLGVDQTYQIDHRPHTCRDEETRTIQRPYHTTVYVNTSIFTDANNSAFLHDYHHMLELSTIYDSM